MCGIGNLGVIGSECRCYMDDSCSVLGSDVVTGDYTECKFAEFHETVLPILATEDFLRMCLCVFTDIWRRIVIQLLAWSHPWHQLRICHPDEFGTGISANNAIRYSLLAVLVCTHGKFFSFGLKITFQTVLGHYHGYRFVGIRIVRLHSHIRETRTNTQGCIRWQRPWCRCPRRKIRCAPFRPLSFWVGNLEQCRHRGIFHVAVASRLVQLVRA